MKVISLFDGMSCGMQALKNLGISVSEYHAFEIDKHAIQVSMKNHPEIIRHGSVVDFDFTRFKDFDLLLAGSPCQGFSFAGKQLAFDDPRSKLFFEFARALKEIKPKYFLLENVNMKKEHLDVISEYCGVNPVIINSNLVSAQNRKRWYWTNIPNITQPEDLGILLKDIVHENNEIETLEKYIVPFDKTLQILNKEVERGKVGYFRKDSQANRVYYIHHKAITLCGDAGGGAAKMGQYLFGHTKKNSQGNRVYTENELAPTLNASSGGNAGNGNLLFGCITPDRIEKRQNGQRFNDGRKFYTLTAQDNHGILIEGYIRKLTPVECERLQTLPDNYTQCDNVSNSQRYKMIGNGWTVKVIEHILKDL